MSGGGSSRQPIGPGAGITIGDGDGALGCFVRSSNGTAYLLSASHVLFSPSSGDRRVRLAASSSCCPGDHVANVTGDQSTTRVTVEYDPSGGNPQRHDGGLSDAALATVADGVPFRNEIPMIGMIRGVPSSPPGFDRQPNFGAGVEARPEQYVRMYSRIQNRVCWGYVLDLPVPHSPPVVHWHGNATVGPETRRLLSVEPGTGGGFRANLSRLFTMTPPATPPPGLPPPLAQFVVIPQPDPHHGAYAARYGPSARGLSFGRQGDSGSVVVNSNNEVIGLFHYEGPRSALIGTQAISHPEWRAVANYGLVTPIAYILDQFRIEIPADFASTAPADAPALAWGSDLDRLGEERLRAALQRGRTGRVIAAKFEQHRTEALQLVNRVRHVGFVWHRNRGPAFFRQARESLRDPQHVIPGVINGCSRARLLREIARVLELYGSDALARDIRRYRGVITAALADAGTLDEAAQRLLAAPAGADRADASLGGER